MTTKALLNLAADVQTIGLVGENINFANKKKKKVGDFINIGTTNLIGTSMLTANKQLIGLID